MKNSGELVFWHKLTFWKYWACTFYSNGTRYFKKNEEKIIRRINELKIPYVVVGSMQELGKVFNKEEITVIGIKDKEDGKRINRKNE